MNRLNIIVRSLAGLLLAGLLCTSCIIDWAPIVVSVYVQDENGNDRLDPASEYFIGDQIKMTYDGEDYPMAIPTKYYMPHFYGLELVNVSESGRWHLRFGEFDGSQSRDDTFTLTWPDGSKDEITFHRTIMSPLIVIDTWHLNGKKTDLPIMILK